jgi:hypothetical protein
MTEVLGVDNALFDVGGLAVARAHYTAMGLVERVVVPEAGIVMYAVGDERPGVLLRARPDLTEGPPTGPRIWLEVPDARAAAAAIPLAPLAQPFEVRTGWTVEYADPWGNVVGLTDYSREPGLARPTRARSPGPA